MRSYLIMICILGKGLVILTRPYCMQEPNYFYDLLLYRIVLLNIYIPCSRKRAFCPKKSALIFNRFFPGFVFPFSSSFFFASIFEHKVRRELKQ